MKSTAITENTSVYETDGRQNGPSVLRPQFAHQFSALVAHRPQKVEDRLPRAVVEIGFIKTAAHHLEKFGHRAQQVILGFWRHVCLQASRANCRRSATARRGQASVP